MRRAIGTQKQVCTGRQYRPAGWFSKCGYQDRIISITWEFITNADSEVQTYRIRNSGAGPSKLVIFMQATYEDHCAWGRRGGSGVTHREGFKSQPSS